MKVPMPDKEAIRLFHEGSIALAQVERNGIRIDEERLSQAIVSTERKIAKLEQRLKNDKVFSIWVKRFRNRTVLGSNQQLATVIFDEMGYDRRRDRFTKSGNLKQDEKAFEHVELPFVRRYFRCEKYKKALTTYLLGIQRELKGGRIHPMISLNTVSTYRSSAQRPNIQNIPVRDEDIGALIRQCVIAEEGFVIGEIDYGGIEVCVSACYHQDPVMVRYIEDETTDMHRDMAMECFKLPKKEVTKMIRYAAKNMFVFPQFYGSYYVDCTKSLWEVAERATTTSGRLLKKHLRSKGIRSMGACDPDQRPKMGTLEAHIQEVERKFWDRRFQIYRQWKKDWWADYLRRGWFRMKTGFICQGRLNRKQVCNSPIQGAAFHCLLWSLIELQRWLNENKMASRILAEVHDSLLIEFHVDEVEDVLKKANEIMTERIREAWPWIVVPLNIEAEVAPIGGTWFDKKKIEVP